MERLILLSLTFDGMDWLSPTVRLLLAVGLVVLCAICWALNLIALPGNWMAVALLGLYAWLGPEQGRTAVSFGVAAAAFALALVGEIIEFAAGALGAQKAGASRRSTVFAMLGSIVGAVAGAIIGIPIPVVGPIVAAILFGGLGATAGAMYGEWSDGRDWRESWAIGRSAFWGKTLGTFGKLLAGLLILAIAIVGVTFNGI